MTDLNFCRVYCKVWILTLWFWWTSALISSSFWSGTIAGFTTSRPNSNYRSPESNMPRRSAIKAGNSKENTCSLLWPNVEHLWDFMPAQDYTLNNVIYGLFQQSRANNSQVTGLIMPEFKLIWDLMPVLVTCKFDKDLINNERASMKTSFSYYSLWEIFPVLKGA